MNELLESLVQNWAKQHRPDAWEKTEKVRPRPDAFRAYLIRLVELRYEAEPEWRTQVPLSVLEETALTAKMRLRGTDRIIDVSGRKVVPRRWGFQELALLMEMDPKLDLNAYAQIKDELDLELEDGQSDAEAKERMRQLMWKQPHGPKVWTPPPPPPPKPERAANQPRLL